MADRKEAEHESPRNKHDANRMQKHISNKTLFGQRMNEITCSVSFVLHISSAVVQHSR